MAIRAASETIIRATPRRVRAERQPHPDLPGALRDRECQQSVDSDARQEQREQRQRAKDPELRGPSRRSAPR